MIFYVILIAVAILCITVAVFSFVAFYCCNSCKILIVTVISAILAAASGCGAIAIENANTKVNTKIVQMEITKCDVTSVMRNGSIYHCCCVTVGDKYFIDVKTEDYTSINVGDIVSVEITTKTIFGEERRPIVTLKV